MLKTSYNQPGLQFTSLFLAQRSQVPGAVFGEGLMPGAIRRRIAVARQLRPAPRLGGTVGRNQEKPRGGLVDHQ